MINFCLRGFFIGKINRGLNIFDSDCDYRNRKKMYEIINLYLS